MHHFALFLLLLAAPALAQQAPAPAMRGDNVTVGLPSATSQRLVTELLAAGAFDVRAFGAVCNGSTDDTTAIQAAINAAGSYSIGGRTILGARVFIPPTASGCRITSTLEIGNGSVSGISTRNAVTLIGQGMPFSRVNLFGSLGATGSRLVWAGSAGGIMLRFNGPVVGGGVQNVAFDAASLAGSCITLISASGGRFDDIACAHYTGAGLDMGTQPTNVIPGGGDSAQLSTAQVTFRNWTGWGDAGSTGIRMDGYVNTASFTASISGTTMTVTAVSSGTLEVGMAIIGTTIPSSVTITALGTGTGGVGTYTISTSLTVGSQVNTGRYGRWDPVRVAMDNVFLRVPASGSSRGVALGFTDQVTVDNLMMFGSGTSDGTSCSIQITSRLVPGEFPQNVVFGGHFDPGQNLPFCNSAGSTATAYGGPGVRFENMTTLDNQVVPREPFTQRAGGTIYDRDGWRYEFGMRVQDRAFRNYIANPRFRRASRGTSFNNTLSGVANGAVTVDGLYYWTDGTLGASWSLQRLATTTAGALDIALNNNLLQPYDPPHYVKLTVGQTTGETFRRIGWRIPNARTLAGRTVTLSAFVAAGGGTPTIGGRLEQVFGTGGSPSSTVVSFAAANQTVSPAVIRRLEWTFTVQSVSGRTFGTNGDDYLGFYLNLPTGASSVDLYIADVQLEAGPVATAFEMRPEWVDEMLSSQTLQVMGGGLTGQALSATDVCLTARMAAPMVRAPSVSLRSGASVTLLEGATSRTAASPAIVAGCSGSTPSSVAFSINGFTGMTSTRGAMTLPMATPPFLLSAEP